MGFALFALSSIARPLRRMAPWARPRPAVPGCTGRECAAPADAAAREQRPRPVACPPKGAATPAPRPLRVVFNRDDGGACRLVISGRMADVCAELDRLAMLH